MKFSGILFVNDERILLLKRTDGTWGIPGGKVEKGETDWEAAVRETKEECGVKQVEGQKFSKFQDENSTIYCLFAKRSFLCKLSDEHVDWEWVKIENVEKREIQPKFLPFWHLFLKKNVKTIDN